MKLSTAKAFCELPTERQNITGTWVFLRMQSTLRLATAIGQVGQALHRLALDAVLDLAVARASAGSSRPPCAMSQAARLPSALRPAAKRMAACGR